MSKIVYIFQPTCSCSSYLGRIQYDFEALTASGVSMVDAATQLGFKMMCCRNSILTVPMYFVLSTNIGRILDRTGTLNGTHQEEDFMVNTPEIVLTRQPPSFPTLPGSSQFTDPVVRMVIPQNTTKVNPLPSMANYLSSLPVSQKTS